LQESGKGQEADAGSAGTGDAEEDIQQSLMALEMQKSYIATMTRQLEMLLELERGMLEGKEVIEAYSGTEEGTEIMIPVGGGAYIHALSASPKKVIVGVGAGVSVEEDADRALERISGEIEKIRKEKESLENNLKMISQQYENLSRKVKADYYSAAEAERGRQ
jgi:prefoldin alpha subunit